VVYGNDHTAMSITVGTPLAIAVKRILIGEITGSGVQIPIRKEIYEPILEELKKYDVVFHEKTIEEKDFKEPYSTL
jgi:saccharopine dehydrogenase (NAD+, L-glutamate forming)